MFSLFQKPQFVSTLRNTIRNGKSIAAYCTSEDKPRRVEKSKLI